MSLGLSTIVGCGGGGGSSGGSGGGGGQIDLTGSWVGTWTSSVVKVSGNLSIDMTLSGQSVSGTITMTSSPCISRATITGTGSDGHFTASIGSATDSISLQGTYTATSMNGTYSVPSGACAGDRGSFSLSKVPAAKTPTSVTVLSSTSDKVELSWTFNGNITSKATGIAIIRKAGTGGIYSVVGSVPANQTYYTDTGLSPGTSYYYKLYAYESYKTDSISPYSNEVSVTTKSFSTAPAAPSDLLATALNGWTIDLSWTDNSLNEDGFLIERSDDGVNFTTIANVKNDIDSFEDEFVTASTTYYYRVKSYNNQGTSTYATYNLTTPTIVPTDLSGGIANNITLTLSNSPYLVSSNVVLAPGYTLTIEPGVQIRFAPATQMEIRGHLEVAGTATTPVVFAASDPTSGSRDYWNGIHVANNLGGSAVIQHAQISNAANAISVDCCNKGGPVDIYDSVFDTNGTAINGYAVWDMFIFRSSFTNNYAGTNTADKIFAYSVFKNNTYGLFSTERIGVYYSTFMGQSAAALNGGRDEVKYCTIINNNIGVQSFFEGFDLSYNTIANNSDIGIILGTYNSNTPAISNNNIYGNVNYNIVNNDSSSKDATNNWWGSTSSTNIGSKIYDFYDDANLGIIEYSPALDKPVDTIH